MTTNVNKGARPVIREANHLTGMSEMTTTGIEKETRIVDTGET